MTALGADLFGDKVNMYNGSLTFEQTDLSIPGNSGLPVALARRHVPGRDYMIVGPFGDWDLDVPRMSGTYAAAAGWTGGSSAGNTSRCTQFAAPPTVTSVGTPVAFNSYDYWNGQHLHVPGQGSQEVLRRVTGNSLAPQDGNSYPLVTHRNWQIACLPSLRMGTGEGFVALSPDGVRYRFDWLVARGVDDVKKLGGTIVRHENFMYATEVTDRFGNWVRYTYNPASPMQLQRIESNDGRVITLTYSGGRIATASDGTKTLTYSYSGPYSHLSGIGLPDGSRWSFNLFGLIHDNQNELGEGANCDFPGAFITNPLVGTMTHPSGATGRFEMGFIMHGTQYVLKSCKYPPGNGNIKPYGAVYPKNSTSQSMLSKTITGPGLAALTWTYSYSGGAGAGSSWSDCVGCPDRKTNGVTNPVGHVTRYTYGNRWRVNEGQLLAVSESDGTTTLRTTSYRYRPFTGQAYPEQFGASPFSKSDWLSTRNAPQDQRIITQQGVTFTWQVDSPPGGFDAWARPLHVNKSSSLGYLKTESTTYHDNLSKWVLGQIDTVVVNGIAQERIEYHAANAQPAKVHSFGRMLQRLAYNGDGTLEHIYDPLDRVTTLRDWHRGIARQITRRDGTVESVTVDNLGLVRSHTNPAGTTRSYGYDAMGRLARIDHPAESWGGYHPTTVSFEQVQTDEYGIPAGHWRQIVSNGNARTIRYYDALWRAGLTHTFDAANQAGTSSFVETHYSHDGKKQFESYPLRSLGSIGGAPPGRTWWYDALRRPTAQREDSELGPLDTVTEYLNSFQRRTTNARGAATVAAFQAYDTPSEDAISAIWAPEGVTTSFQRDPFGKAQSITRSGTYDGSTVSATRQYIYDWHQRLCKTVEPESGATIQAHDAAGNVAWRASGMPHTAPDCQHGSVPGVRMATFGYDAMDRLTSTSYGDGSPGITRRYSADGLLHQIFSGANAWTYHHNNRRLLVHEQATWWAGASPGQGWNFVWSFNSHGHVQSLQDPWGAIEYAPNALGQPTQVSGYATQVAYHPNGALAGYRAGNGIQHNVTLNTRGLPEWWQHVGISNDRFAYDAVGNVTSIADHQEGGATSRSMSYDWADRLYDANGIWGSAHFRYDALDNIRKSIVGSRNADFYYDNTNRLSSGVISGGTAYFHYDLNGNLAARSGTAVADQTFTFDIGNRLSASPGKSTYLYDGHRRRMQVSHADGRWKLNTYTLDGKLRFGYDSQTPLHTRYVYLGNALIAEVKDLEPSNYVHTDALGSPVARTNTSGQLVSRTRYEPYGGTAGGVVPAQVGFTGHVNDADTGLVYMQQRYYDPVAGRFLSVDPVTTSARDGSGFNLYSYAENNPYKYRDPDGRCTGSRLCPGGSGLGTGSSGFVYGLGSSGTSSSQQSAPAPATGANAPGGQYIEPTWEEIGVVVDTAANIATVTPVGPAVRAAQGTAKVGSLVATHGRTMSNRQLDKLTKSIREAGEVKQPLTVTEHQGKTYVLDGHHRAIAAQRAGVSDVPVNKVDLPFGAYRTPADLIRRD